MMHNLNNEPMPSPMEVIRGTIVSNKKASSQDWDREALCAAFIENGLEELLTNGAWGVGGISFNSHSPVVGKSNRHGGIGKYAAAKKGITFANAINGVMQTQVAEELELNGYFEVLIDTGREPVIFNVDVEDGEVSYQQVQLILPKKTILPEPIK